MILKPIIRTVCSNSFSIWHHVAEDLEHLYCLTNKIPFPIGRLWHADILSNSSDTESTMNNLEPSTILQNEVHAVLNNALEIRASANIFTVPFPLFSVTSNERGAVNPFAARKNHCTSQERKRPLLPRHLYKAQKRMPFTYRGYLLMLSSCFTVFWASKDDEKLHSKTSFLATTIHCILEKVSSV